MISYWVLLLACAGAGCWFGLAAFLLGHMQGWVDGQQAEGPPQKGIE